MTSNEQQQTSDAPSYPLFGIAECLKVGEAVATQGGNTGGVSKALLAKALGMSEGSGGFGQRVGSAKCFGVIEGRGNYSLTSAARRYFFPTSEHDKAVAALEFLQQPKAFRELLSRYDGQKLPTNELMGNVLMERSKVPKSWKDRVAAIFVRSAQFLGVIDAQGYLRHSAGKETAGISRQEEGRKNDKPGGGETGRTPPPTERQPSAGATVWVYPCQGQEVRVETPPDLTYPAWEKLKQYVEVLKPAKESAT